MSEFQDRTLVCADCNGTFVFTAGEQAFYQERGFSEPKRCPACRSARKARRSGEGASGSRSSENRSNWNSGFGGGDQWSHRERSSRQMYEVICADCGQPAQVPFKPRDDRPVYCKDCYENHRYR